MISLYTNSTRKRSALPARGHGIFKRNATAEWTERGETNILISFEPSVIDCVIRGLTVAPPASERARERGQTRPDAAAGKNAAEGRGNRRRTMSN